MNWSVTILFKPYATVCSEPFADAAEEYVVCFNDLICRVNDWLFDAIGTEIGSGNVAVVTLKGRQNSTLLSL